ncbi:MAG: electron transfer flavoprotein-quinone oxidoreductase [Tepidanaerobacteraceae bacterium]|nr:electron transfer flavoprotein-quinone oxidoreductase [Tepidanaerobacteraceae bacterium]
MSDDKYDAIVVGAGPAGSSAALTMAENNMSVLLLERGEYPGAKNVFGGTIYCQPTEIICPAFWEEAPLERPVTSEELWLLDNDSAVKIGFTGLRFAKPPYNKFTALRSKFDRWLAEKAKKAGADLVTGTLAKELIYDGGRARNRKAIGVLTENGDRIYSDIVIIAEGVTGNLVETAGLQKKISPDSLTLYVKEVMELPSNKIEERFNLGKDEGAVLGLVGYPSSGAIGKGAIFTNKDSISIMVGAYLNQLIEKGLNPFLLMDRLKKHPLIKRLIEGAKIVEFQAHTIPKGGFGQMPKLFSPGVMVVGDAAAMIVGRRGADLAMLTGKFAGETATQAKAANNFSESLAAYEKKVNSSFFLQDMKAGRKTKDYYRQHPDADFLLTKAANQVAYEYFTVDMVPHHQKIENIIGKVASLQPLPKTIEDIYQGFFHWGVF